MSDCNMAIPQIANYAMFLTEQQEPERGISELQKLSGIIKDTIPMTVWICQSTGNPWNHLSDDCQSSASQKHILKELSKYMKRSGLMNQK